MEEETKSVEARQGGKNSDEIALELMKFIAHATGFGKGAQSVGFAGKGARTPEEQADALLELFERCRGVVARKG